MVDERIAARRAEVRAERRRRRLRRTIVVAALLVLGIVGALVERSSLVALAEVRVEGTARLSPRTVQEAADLPLGTSTLRLRMGAAAQRVEALPLVLSAEARRVSPRAVLVTVVEREPVMVLLLEATGDTVLVDVDGQVIAEGTEPGLAVVRMGQDATLPAPGDAVREVPAAANAHAAWSAMPQPLRARVVTFVATGNDQLDLELDDGTRVRFGRAERVDEKVRALGAVLDDLAGRQVAEIDVRAPSRPVVIPQPTPTPTP